MLFFLLAFAPGLLMGCLGMILRRASLADARGPKTPLEKEMAFFAALHGVRGLCFKTEHSPNAGAFGGRGYACLVYCDSPSLIDRPYYRWLLRHEIGHLKNCDTSGIWLRVALVSLTCAIGCWYWGTGRLATTGLVLASTYAGWQGAARRAERLADVFATENTPSEELDKIAGTFLACAARGGRFSEIWRTLSDCHPTLRERAALVLSRSRKNREMATGAAAT